MGKFNLAEHIAPPVLAEGRTIEAITTEILGLKRTAGNAILDIGRRLIEAKAILPHGEWLPWLEQKVDFSERTAQGFMAMARSYSNPQTLADLGASKALMLLALPDSERDDFIESVHVVDGEGKTVQEMSTRELKQAIRERDEARAAAEQSDADRRAAEETAAKMSADMVLANERIAGLNAELEAKAREAAEAGAEFDRLTAELQAMRDKPVEVAVQVDESAVERAREEGLAQGKAAGESAAKDKLDKAEKDLAKAKDRASKAETARKAAEDALAAAKAQLAEKKTAVSMDEDLALFKLLFNQTQDCINRMYGLLLKYRGKDEIMARKLSAAMEELSVKTKEAAQG